MITDMYLVHVNIFALIVQLDEWTDRNDERCAMTTFIFVSPKNKNEQVLDLAKQCRKK